MWIMDLFYSLLIIFAKEYFPAIAFINLIISITINVAN